MRWGRREPLVETVLLVVRVPPEDVAAWAEDTGAPCWIQQLPGGWTLARTATVNGALVGSRQSADDALRVWTGRTPDAYLAGDVVRAVRGAHIEVLDGLDEPWVADDPRPVHGLVAVRGDRADDLGLLAHLQAKPAAAVYRDGWTLVPHDNPLWASAPAVVDGAPGLALMTVGDEAHLWLIDDGEPIAGWQWCVTGRLAATDRLPPGELGDHVRDLVFPTRLGVEPFDDFGFRVTPALVRALATDGRAETIVPQLVRALELPDAARAHLLGERDLAAEPDVRTSEPAGTLAGAVAGSVWASEKQRASAQSPRRRLWGAIGWAASLLPCALLAFLIVDDLHTGNDVSIWTWLRVPLVLLVAVVAVIGIRRWWVLRGTGQRDPSDLSAGIGDRDTAEPVRWFDRRGPSTAIALALGLVGLAGCVAVWMFDAPLRDHGVRTTAQVIAVDEDTITVTFRDQHGNAATVEITPWGEPQPGDSIAIVYDPADPSHAMTTEELDDPIGYVIVGTLSAAFLIVALLTWTRAIDWHRVRTGIEQAPGI